MPNYSVISGNQKNFANKLGLFKMGMNVQDLRGKMLFEVMSLNESHQKYLIQLQDAYHLFSFAYQDVYNKLSSKVDKKHIVMDSGGYSIHTSGLELTIDDYINFLKTARYNHAFNFDVIGNPEQTYLNQKYIEENGLQVIPVFHIGTPYKWLQKYIDEGYDYISLGGMVGKHNKYKIPFLNKCFALGMKNGGVKFHGLGLGHDYCKKYPLYSIDNSNHIMVRRNGKLKIDGKDIKIKKVHGETKEERRWNDAMPVLIQLSENIKQYKKIVEENWWMYHKYFNGKIGLEEVLG